MRRAAGLLALMATLGAAAAQTEAPRPPINITEADRPTVVNAFYRHCVDRGSPAASSPVLQAVYCRCITDELQAEPFEVFRRVALRLWHREPPTAEDNEMTRRHLRACAPRR